MSDAVPLPQRTRPGRSLRVALTGAVAGLITCAPALASAAENKLAFDGEAVLPEDKTGFDNGWAAGVRLGHNWDLWLIELTPELGGSYHSFGGSADATAFRVFGGARLGVGFILKPSVFAHAGVGHFSYTAMPEDISHTGMGYDVGLALDFTLLPLVDIGAHAALAGVSGNAETDGLSWVAIGGHIAFSLGGD